MRPGSFSFRSVRSSDLSRVQAREKQARASGSLLGTGAEHAHDFDDLASALVLAASGIASAQVRLVKNSAGSGGFGVRISTTTLKGDDGGRHANELAKSAVARFGLSASVSHNRLTGSYTVHTQGSDARSFASEVPSLLKAAPVGDTRLVKSAGSYSFGVREGVTKLKGPHALAVGDAVARLAAEHSVNAKVSRNPLTGTVKVKLTGSNSREVQQSIPDVIDRH